MNKIQIICNNRQKKIIDYIIGEFIKDDGCPFGYDEIEECGEDCEKCIDRNIIYKCILK